MWKSLTRPALNLSVISAMCWLSSQVAMGQAGAPTNLPSIPSIPSTVATAAVADAAAPSATFISTGTPMAVEALGIAITPPAGWEVSTNTGTLSLVMSEPRQTAPDYEKAKYQRNITVAAIHHAAPIDELRATELANELTKNFAADGSVANFHVIEHKFFNYRGTNDGLIVYSSLNLGDYSMMQMHMLVSGQEKQFLLTYTDLAERFTDNKDVNFEKAWNSMVSLEVAGKSPLRIDQYTRYGAFGGGVFLLFLALMLIRRRAGKHDYASEADEFMDGSDASPSMFATLAGGWKLNDADDGKDSDGLEFSHAASGIYKTRQTEYVSNY